MADPELIDGSKADDHGQSVLQRLWRGFCRVLVRIFYHRREAHGLERIPTRGPVLICANHPNALVDPIIIQAFCPRIIHPLARSGLFEHVLMRPFLNLLHAVPIYRRQDSGVDPSRNVESFARCHELLAQGEILLIFPEGQTHSDARLRTVKTGAARLAWGSIETSGVAPTVLPVGLTFGDKGRFRSSVFVEVGDAVGVEALLGEQPEDTVRRLTGLIEAGLKEVTLNAESLDELDLSRRLERFFALRRGRYRRGSLKQRFRALKKLIQSRHVLRQRNPEWAANVSRRLWQFERLCRRFGVRDYQLTLRYSPVVVTRFVVRSLLMLFLVLPLALWGTINSAIPFVLIPVLVLRLASEYHEYDTARMAFALGIFVVAWTVQTLAVAWLFGGLVGVFYLLSLPPTTAAAVLMHREKDRIIENLKGFFLLIRKRRLRDYLLTRRKDLEKELAQMARSLRR